jgi:dTDP-D-glucose 4,6-dehydratase
MLGWLTQYTIEDGLKESIDWYRNYFSQVRAA